MHRLSFYIISFLLSLCNGNRLEDFSTVEDFLNVCIDGQEHKSAPGPESTLFQLCTPYKNWACCTDEIAQQLHLNSTWYKFSWDHCQELSPRCKQHFQRDLCFYECSPNVGPWLVQEDRSWRNERVYKVPLCASECKQWYSDCEEEFTCVKNWAKDFSWIKGVQQCPKNTETGDIAQCIQFKHMWTSAEEFCEKIWDYSWKVVPDSEPCMKINFKSGDVESNAQVAKMKAEEIVKQMKKVQTIGSASSAAPSLLLYAASVPFLLFRCQ